MTLDAGTGTFHVIISRNGGSSSFDEYHTDRHHVPTTVCARVFKDVVDRSRTGRIVPDAAWRHDDRHDADDDQDDDNDGADDDRCRPDDRVR